MQGRLTGSVPPTCQATHSGGVQVHTQAEATGRLKPPGRVQLSPASLHSMARCAVAPTRDLGILRGHLLTT